MSSLTLNEIVAGGAAYGLYKVIFGERRPDASNKIAPGEANKTMRIMRKIEEIRRSGGASPEITRSLMTTLLTNGIVYSKLPREANDPIFAQAFLSIAVEDLATETATIPAFRAPQTHITYSQNGMAERLNGWKAIQGTDTKPTPQGNNLIS